MAAGRVDRAGDQTAAALKAVALAAVLAAGSACAADQWWAYDKGEHLIATTTISALGTQLPRFWVESIWVRDGVGFGAAVVIGAGKELLDMTGFGDPSWKDFAWDVIGGVVGTVVSIAFEWVWEQIWASHPSPAASRHPLPPGEGNLRSAR